MIALEDDLPLHSIVTHLPSFVTINVASVVSMNSFAHLLWNYLLAISLSGHAAMTYWTNYYMQTESNVFSIQHAVLFFDDCSSLMLWCMTDN